MATDGLVGASVAGEEDGDGKGVFFREEGWVACCAAGAGVVAGEFPVVVEEAGALYGGHRLCLGC